MIGRFRTSPGQTRPISGEFSMPGQVASQFATSGPNLVDSVPISVERGRVRADVIDAGPSSVESGPLPGRRRAEVRGFRANVGRTRSNIGQTRPELGRVRASLAEFGRCCPRLRLNMVLVEPNSTSSGPISSESGPGLDQIWAMLTQFGKCRPAFQEVPRPSSKNSAKEPQRKVSGLRIGAPVKRQLGLFCHPSPTPPPPRFRQPLLPKRGPHAMGHPELAPWRRAVQVAQKLAELCATIGLFDVESHFWHRICQESVQPASPEGTVLALGVQMHTGLSGSKSMEWGPEARGMVCPTRRPLDARLSTTPAFALVSNSVTSHPQPHTHKAASSNAHGSARLGSDGRLLQGVTVLSHACSG